MSAGAKDIEFPLIDLGHCSTQRHCEALCAVKDMPFWWYQDVSRFFGNFSLPFQDSQHEWWYQVRPQFAWPVAALDPLSQRSRYVPVLKSLLGYQHVLPPSEPSNSTLVINTIVDLPAYGVHVINDKRRNAIRKGAKACEVFAIQSIEDRWLDDAVKAWNDLVDRTGWKHHRDRNMIRDTWTELLTQPAATILFAVDKATGKLAGFLITKVYGQTAYVDTIASNSDLLHSNPNDILMYTFIRNAQRIPGIRNLHFAIKSTAEPLEKFKTSLGCEPFPYSAYLHTRPGMLTGLRIVHPRMYTRLTARPAWGRWILSRPAPVESAVDREAAERERARLLGEAPAAPARTFDAFQRQRSISTLEVEQRWDIPPKPPPATGWLVYSRDFILAALQGRMTSPQEVHHTVGWHVLALGVLCVVGICQSALVLLAHVPIVSTLMEIIARVFSRNAAGFFLRSCYWKAKLRHLGQDTLIDQNVEIWGPKAVSIGSQCHIDTNVRLAGGDPRYAQRGWITIGDYVHLGPGVHVAGRGGVKIGDFVGIMANAHIYSATGVLYRPDDPGRLMSMTHMAPADQQQVLEAPVYIDSYACIGMMSRIMPGVRVGRAAVIHANSELTTSVPPFANFGGGPRARQIGLRLPRHPSRRVTPLWPLVREERPEAGLPQPQDEIKIRELTDPYEASAVSQVAELHATAFPQGPTTQLGRQYLLHMYTAMIKCSGTYLWVAEKDDKVCGFIGATLDRRAFAHVRWPRYVVPLFAWRLATGAIDYQIARRSWRKAHQAYRLPERAELLSIVVSPEVRRSGLGKRLFDAWWQRLVIARMEGFIVLTDNPEGENFYHKHGGEVMFNFRIGTLNTTCFRFRCERLVRAYLNRQKERRMKAATPP